MKFTINKKVFVNSLKDVKKGTVKKSTDPKLSGRVRVIAGLDNIQLTVIGMYSELVKAVNCNGVDQLGGIIMNLPLLIKVLPKLNGDTIQIATTGDDKITIKSGSTVLTVSALNISKSLGDLPEPKENKTTVKGSDLKRSLRGAFKAVSRLDERPVLTGVDFKITHGAVRMESTDSHQLFTDSINTVDRSAGRRFDMLLRSNDLKTFTRLMNNEPVNIYHSNINGFAVSQFKQHNLRMIFKDISGNYPGVDQCIIKNNAMNHHVLLNRLALKKAVNQVKAVGNNKGIQVASLHIVNNNVSLTAHDNELGDIKTKIKPVKLSSNGLNISFDPNKVLNALNAYPRVENVDLRFMQPLKPFTIEPHDDTDRYYMVCPLRTF